MTYSLNEIAATTTRAARGAGYSTGLAQEVGMACRWLHSHGVDGVWALARLLQNSDLNAPEIAGAEWQAKGALCPIQTGAALSDRARLINDDITLHRVAAPVLILPFAAQTARLTGKALSLNAQNGTALIDGSALTLTGDWGMQSATLTLATGLAITKPRPTETRADPRPDDWQILLEFAHKTYAPATEASRALGAGAGQSDND
jgi:hypothetical protein